MKPTQEEIEDEIKRLASLLNDYNDQAQRLVIRLRPYLDKLSRSIDHFVDQSTPKFKKVKLYLEILYLKSQLKMIDALIEAKQAVDSEKSSKREDKDQADDRMSPAE